ncbi:unnamed protein product, partial [Darwinula stevensoni]
MHKIGFALTNLTQHPLDILTFMKRGRETLTSADITRMIECACRRMRSQHILEVVEAELQSLKPGA